MKRENADWISPRPICLAAPRQADQSWSSKSVGSTLSRSRGRLNTISSDVTTGVSAPSTRAQAAWISAEKSSGTRTSNGSCRCSAKAYSPGVKRHIRCALARSTAAAAVLGSRNTASTTVGSVRGQKEPSEKSCRGFRRMVIWGDFFRDPVKGHL